MVLHIKDGTIPLHLFDYEKGKIMENFAAREKEKLVMLFVGQYDTGAYYPQYTKADIQCCTEATGFVIANSGKSAYLNASMNNFTAFISSYITGLATIISGLGKKFYVGIPPVVLKASSTTAYTTEYTNLKTFYAQVATAVGSLPNFHGFYWTGECIAQPANITVDNPTAHTYVKLMNDCAYVVRNDPSGIKKRLIWAPYAGFGPNFMDFNKSIAIIANKCGIFNTIFVQSQYYFGYDATRGWATSPTLPTSSQIPKENKELIGKNGKDNAFSTFTSAAARTTFASVCPKTSATEVGIDIEIDSQAYDLIAAKNAYKETVAAYNDAYNNGSGFFFYCGSKTSYMRVYPAINAFFKNGTSPF